MRSIRVTDTYEIRRCDSLNWQVWRYKEAEKGKSKGEMEWVRLPSFHGSVRSALQWIANNAMREERADVDVDLEGAIEALRGIERDIAAHADAFEGRLS